MRSLIAFILVVITLSGCAENITSVDIESGRVVVNSSSGETINIGPGTSYSVSPDRRKIVVVLKKYPIDSLVEIQNNSYDSFLGIYSFDVNSSETSILASYPNKGFNLPFGEIEWSPDSRLVMIDSGTGPTRGKYTFLVKRNMYEDISFKCYSDQYALLQNERIIFTEPLVIENRTGPPTESMEGAMSVVILDYKGKRTVLFEGSEYEAFYLNSVKGSLVLIDHKKWEVEFDDEHVGGYDVNYTIDETMEYQLD